MSKLNHQKLPIAAQIMSHLDLSCDHVTSSQFMMLQPVYYRHMIKMETIDVNALSTVRLMPMTVPCYGRLRQNLRAFFIPYRLVFPQFDSYMLDTIGVNYTTTSLVDTVPEVQNNTLADWLRLEGTHLTDQTADNYDYMVAGTKYYLSYEGLRKQTLLNSLGYRVNFDTNDRCAFNCLALLAVCKVYIDWYANSQYLDTSAVLHVRKLLSYNDPSAPLVLTLNDLASIWDLVSRVYYDTDNYFNSAWDSPSVPNNGQHSDISVADFADSGNPSLSVARVGFNSVTKTPVMQTTDASKSIGTEYLHDMLRKVTNYQKRHQLAGAYEIDRWLAEYGDVPQYQQLMRSIYVGGKSQDIRIGDVTSMADTAPAGQPSNLGEYAGKGFGQGSNAWKFKADEYGIFIVFATILPSAGFFQGVDRHNLHLSKLDFFNPEFDSVSMQGIARREVYVSRNDTFGTNGFNSYDGVFGYVGRYGEYKRPLNYFTGSLSSPYSMPGGSSWHLMRQFTDKFFGADASYINHSDYFASGIDSYQYNRIFNFYSSNYFDNPDNFICEFHFDVGSYAPCSPLFETYDFHEDAKQITLMSNGAKLN